MKYLVVNPSFPNRKERRTAAAINRKLMPVVQKEVDEHGIPLVYRLIRKAKTGSNRSRPLTLRNTLRSN